jgi:hypothetical protein
MERPGFHHARTMPGIGFRIALNYNRIIVNFVVIIFYSNLEGEEDFNVFEGKDKNIIKIVFLFDIFHKFRDDFDQLSKGQEAAQDEPVQAFF